MLNPWLTLGTLAFVASFGMTLLMTRDLGGSIIAGSLAVATGFVTAAAVNWYHHRSANSRIASLRYQIRLLQQRRQEEQQAVSEMAAEKERVSLALNSMQDELRQRQLPGLVPFSRPTLSWDLSSEPEVQVMADDRPILSASDIDPDLHPTALAKFIADAAATKQKITASLNHLQTELAQRNAQVKAQQQRREQLTREIKQLGQQKTSLITTAKELNAEVEQLEQCRADLDQYISYVDTKKQELESGSNPLQKALQQLQAQVSALQAELSQLEAQVTAKRQEKEQLERDLANLKPQQNQAKALQERIQQLESQKASLERDGSNLKPQQSQAKSSQADLQKLEKQIADRKKEKDSLERQITQLQAQKTSLRNQPASNPTPVQPGQEILSVQNGNGKPALISRPVVRSQPDAIEATDSATQELSDRWTDFMVQLPEYELQALKAIAQESDPTPIITRLAEDNFTTPDELIHSINQRAAEIVGATVIKARSGTPAAIVRDHQRTIKKLIETYEYLTQ